MFQIVEKEKIKYPYRKFNADHKTGTINHPESRKSRRPQLIKVKNFLGLSSQSTARSLEKSLENPYHRNSHKHRTQKRELFPSQKNLKMSLLALIGDLPSLLFRSLGSTGLLILAIKLHCWRITLIYWNCGERENSARSFSSWNLLYSLLLWQKAWRGKEEESHCPSPDLKFN